MIGRYPHLSGAILLLFVLGIPFFLRTVAPAFEVYPSVVFPARATSVDVASNEIIYVQRELYGIRDGQEVRLDPIRFLDPIPLQNLGVLFERSFSLDPNRRRRVYFKYLPLSDRFIKVDKISETEREQTKEWLGARLVEQGCEPETLILRKRRYVVDRSTWDNLDTETLDESTLKLN